MSKKKENDVNEDVDKKEEYKKSNKSNISVLSKQWMIKEKKQKIG
jgi:hypothetical protein